MTYAFLKMHRLCDLKFSLFMIMDDIYIYDLNLAVLLYVPHRWTQFQFQVTAGKEPKAADIGPLCFFNIYSWYNKCTWTIPLFAMTKGPLNKLTHQSWFLNRDYQWRCGRPFTYNQALFQSVPFTICPKAHLFLTAQIYFKWNSKAYKVMQLLITIAINQPRFILMKYIISCWFFLFLFFFLFSFWWGFISVQAFRSPGFGNWLKDSHFCLLTLLFLMSACSKVRVI